MLYVPASGWRCGLKASEDSHRYDSGSGVRTVTAPFRLPRYRHDKPKDFAFVRIDGRDVYLVDRRGDFRI